MKTLTIILLLVALVGCDSQATPTVKPTPTAGAPTKGIPTGERIVAEGRVTPVRSADLSPSATGVVAEVLVAEGDKVKKDQALLRVDAKRQTAAVAQAQAALDKANGAKTGAEAALSKAQAALALLKAGARPEDVAVAQAALAVAQSDLARAQAGADATTLAKAKADVDKAARAVQQAQFAYDRVKDTPGGANGPDALRLEQATIDYNLAKTVYEQLAQGPREVDVNAAKARVAQAHAALNQAQAGARAEQLNAAEADVTTATGALKNLNADVAAAEAALAQAKATLADTELRTPFDGVVALLNVEVGEVVPVGSFAVRIADLSAWQIETTDLTELSVANIHAGMPVTLTFDAVPGLELTGKVGKVRAYGETKQGDIVYTVFITPDQQNARLRWNMTAKVSIEGGK